MRCQASNFNPRNTQWIPPVKNFAFLAWQKNVTLCKGLKGNARWIDKTPSYVDILDFIDLLFGKECRYIMLYRYGLDVANSMATAYEREGLAGLAKRYADEYRQSPRLAFAHYWGINAKKCLPLNLHIRPMSSHLLWTIRKGTWAVFATFIWILRWAMGTESSQF